MKKFFYLLTAIGLLCNCSPKAKQTQPADTCAEEKHIVLSFDDGPNTTTTVEMLDMMKKHEVVGSFFVVGNHINEESAKVMKRALDMGCDIQNHSKTHSNMTELNAEQLKEEINYTSNLIEKHVGVKPTFFRPPYIAVNQLMYDTIELPFICGQGCNDWEEQIDTKQRAEMVIKNAEDGQIILLHDFEGNKATVEALDIIIPELKKQGYRFVTVSELFKLKKVTPKLGVLYTNVLKDK